VIELTNAKRKIIYKSTHRGCKEMDYIFGNYIKNYLNSCSANEIATLENLINESDLDILNWISNNEIIPAKYKVIIHDLKKSL
jgi:antitoxin CptB